MALLSNRISRGLPPLRRTSFLLTSRSPFKRLLPIFPSVELDYCSRLRMFREDSIIPADQRKYQLL
jgi:hypothetical protein